ncbi:MAG: adenylate/guanylate cyclase domain-containing protein, partial [Leptospiraceae bacterium]|nr:adenylate/guanylate cyclase domain-containing protein [Leptospiraceae bacterium]
MKYPSTEKFTKLEWEIQVNVPLEKVWNYVSNTDRINKAMGFDEVTYKLIPSEFGGTVLYGTTKDGGLTSVYREYPFEWVEGQFVKVYREYTQGIFKKMIFSIQYFPNSTSFTARFLIAAELKTSLLKPILTFQAKKKIIPKFNQIFLNVEKFHKGETKEVYPKKDVNDTKVFHEILKKLEQIPSNPILREKIAHLISNSFDEDLLKIRIKKLSKQLGENSKEVLRFFLQGARLGIFDVNYDILCPSCRGSKSSSKHLFELKEKVHCPSCNIEYGSEFDRNVEVTFTPNPSLKNINAKLYCFGGPGTTPHIRAQIRVEPNSKEKISFYFKSGEYKITSLQTNQTLYLSVASQFQKIPKISYPSQGHLEVAEGEVEIEFENQNSYEIVCKVARDYFAEEILTAHEITTLQEFRDLFSSEVLRPDQEIAIQSLCILFTDLEGSTKFYNENGDALAYKIVSEHFDILIKNAYKYEGAVVKTIGDAILAVFRIPINALRYAIDVQREFEELRKKYPQNNMKLKVGLHMGPVIA